MFFVNRLIRDAQRLDPAPLRFLFFSAGNVMSFQCVVGTVLILFCRYIEMPAHLVGWTISFNAFSGALAVFTVPLVSRFGPRLVLMLAWLLRTVAILPVLTMPLVQYRYGEEAAWYLLMGCTFAFSFLRGLGVGGWYPFLRETLPRHQRGLFFSAEMSLTHLVNITLSLLVSATLVGNPSVYRFLLIYGAGIVAGFVSIYLLHRVPAPVRDDYELQTPSDSGSFQKTFRNKEFMRFVWLSAAAVGATLLMATTEVLYLRDGLGFSAGFVMLLAAGGSLAVAITIQHWGHYTDNVGSPHSMFLTLSGSGWVGLAWPWVVAQWEITPFLVWPFVMAGYLLNAAYWTSMHRGFLDHVPDEERLHYTNVWLVAVSLAMGAMPILAGATIEAFGIWGYRLNFLLGGASCLYIGSKCADLPNLESPGVRHLRYLIRPTQPARTLGRLVWVSLGKTVTLEEPRHPSRPKVRHRYQEHRKRLFGTARKNPRKPEVRRKKPVGTPSVYIKPTGEAPITVHKPTLRRRKKRERNQKKKAD